jgi:hypothetical protein
MLTIDAVSGEVPEEPVVSRKTGPSHQLLPVAHRNSQIGPPIVVLT